MNFITFHVVVLWDVTARSNMVGASVSEAHVASILTVR